MSERKKVKLIILASLLVVVALIAINIFLLVKIKQDEKRIASQQEEITKLENEKNYYQSI